jgi:hypothetical protein
MPHPPSPSSESLMQSCLPYLPFLQYLHGCISLSQHAGEWGVVWLSSRRTLEIVVCQQRRQTRHARHTRTACEPDEERVCVACCGANRYCRTAIST